MFKVNRLFVFLLLIAQSAVGQSWLSRQWHNSVTHYNYYYNANLLVSDVREESLLAYKDNFKDVLSLYPIPESSQLKGNAARMDEALKKCSNIIEKHPQSKWIDDSYLLMGDAHLFKGDFYSALEVYEYVAGSFKKSIPALQAEINIITTYILQGKYEDAEALYTKLSSKKEFPSKLKTQLDIAGAAVNIKQKKYQVAIKLLEQAIPKVKNKIKKIRYNFVLAQLYALNKQNPNALEKYKKVIKLNPPYEFAFNSKLSMAKTINYKNRSEVKNAKTVLREMLRDDKNIDYFDQIYYELGNLELADKNENGAIDEYKHCLGSKTNDLGIKSGAYLALADLYFKHQDYENAQIYYDSAARTIEPTHPDYDFVQEKNLVLNELIKHLVNIKEKDSLLLLASDDRLREKTIDKLIKEEKDRVEKEKQLEELKKIQQNNLTQNQPNISTSFPFYNMAAKNKGVQDFQRIWGSFELSDYWGIASNRQKELWKKIDLEQTTNDLGSAVKKELLDKAPEERKKYYQNIPFTQTEKDKMRDEISESYFLGANVYYQNLKEYDKAKDLLNQLNKRYPKSKYEINSWYLLARIFRDLKNEEKANYYIELIRNADSSSTFLNVLENKVQDSAKIEKPNTEVDDIYALCYEAYKKGDYVTAINKKKEHDSKYSGSPLQVNFDYVEALTIGKQGDLKLFKEKLQAIVDNYPNSEIAKECLKTIELIKIKTGETVVPIESGKYSYAADADHFYILLVPKGVDITQLKIAFLNYNKTYHTKDELRVTTSLLGDQYQILIVNNFKTLEAVLAYIKEVNEDSKFMNEIKLEKKEDHMAISKQNFSVLISDKVLADYLIFYKSHYKL
ncbi:MAG: tetratricopeptide repeat protein [Bacteroidia bacterium]|nr:tetratricopeptide repeat protein [Bacteroidia bacterium]